MVCQLVEDRAPDLLGQLSRVGEVLLERQSEERDLVGEGDPVRAVFDDRGALVQAVQGLIGREALLSSRDRVRLVLDDDGDRLEQAADVGGQLVQGALDEPLEGVLAPARPRGTMRGVSAGLVPAMAEGHDILGWAPAGGREVATYASEVSSPSAWSVPPAPAPDTDAEPTAVTVTLDTGDRLHVLDWGSPLAGTPPLPPLLLVHGLTQTAWAWAPVARRLRALTRVLAVDLRGHGLSETPRTGYDLDSFAYDLLTVLVAHGIGPDAGGPSAVLAGHGFGAGLAAWTARLQATAVAGLALVDGGWETLEESLGMGDAEFLRGLAEPPEVLASMAAYLADRRDWDPASWDADQERAERARVDEKVTGRVSSVVRRHALAGSVGAMFAYRPETALVACRGPLLVLVAEPGGADDPEIRERRIALHDVLRVRAAAAPAPSRVVRFGGVAHNLMRYRPAEVAAELAGLLAASRETAP